MTDVERNGEKWKEFDLKESRKTQFSLVKSGLNIAVCNTERSCTMENVVIHIRRLAQKVRVSSRPHQVCSTVFECLLMHIMDYSGTIYLNNSSWL